MTIEEQKARKQEYDKEYRKRNKEKIAKRKREWYDKHKDEKSIYDKKYRTEHTEQRKQAKKDWYNKNRDRVSDTNKKYYETIDGIAARRRNHYVWEDRHVIHSDTSETVTKEWIIDNILNSKCLYCCDDIPGHLGCDRIDDNKGHTPDNVICACGICNSERKILKMSVREFVEYRKAHPREKERFGDGTSYQTKDGIRIPLKKKNFLL